MPLTLEAAKLEDINRVVITTLADGTPIFVRNIAKVVIGNHPRLGLVGRTTPCRALRRGPSDEDDVVEGIVLMRKYEQSLPTAEKVLEKLKEIEDEKRLPEGMHVQIFNRRTDLVHVTTHNVLHNLLVRHGPGRHRLVRVPGQPHQCRDRRAR